MVSILEIFSHFGKISLESLFLICLKSNSCDLVSIWHQFGSSKGQRQTLMSPLVKLFDQVGVSDISEIGQRNHDVATSRQNVQGRSTGGIVTTSMAYWYFLDTSQLFDRLLFEQRNMTDGASVISARCKELILSAKIPYNLHKELIKGCQQLLFHQNSTSSEIELSGSILHEQFPHLQFKTLPEVSIKPNELESVITGVKHLYASLFDEEILLEVKRLGYRHMDLSVSCSITTSFRLQMNAA